MNVGQWVVIGISIFIGAWYLTGFYYNRRQGERTLTWLRTSLEPWGKISSVRLLGSFSSGAQLEINRANAPFQSLEVTFVLESRENLPLWLFNRLQGRRDEIFFKANLRSIPEQEIVVGRETDPKVTQLIDPGERRPFELVRGPGGFMYAWRGRQDGGRKESLANFLEHYGEAVQRLVFQRDRPNLALRAWLAPLRNREAGEFFEAIGDLAGES